MDNSVNGVSIFKKTNTKPVLVGVTGGTASGKTTVCEYLFTKPHYSTRLILSFIQ